MSIRIGTKLLKHSINCVSFLCPGCTAQQGRRIIHMVWLDRWAFNGKGDAPTFSPSISYNSPRGHFYVANLPSCHSFVQDGKIRYLSDCTHPMAGQTVDLPDRPDEDDDAP